MLGDPTPSAATTGRTTDRSEGGLPITEGRHEGRPGAVTCASAAAEGAAEGRHTAPGGASLTATASAATTGAAPEGTSTPEEGASSYQL